MAGAGVAGVAAALAAARRGCRVVLLEKESCIGGTAVGGAVGAICGLYRNGMGTSGDLLNAGITGEIVNALLQVSPGRIARKAGKVFILPFSPPELANILCKLCTAEPNLSLVTDAAIQAVASTDGLIHNVSAGGGSAFSIPKVIIDASGNGELAYTAGAAYEISPREEVQLAGFTVMLEGVTDATRSLGLKVPFVISKGVESGVIPEFFKLTVFIEGEREGQGFLKINLPDTAESREKDMATAAKVLLEYLGKELTEFRRASCKSCSSGIYSREGRRIIGQYTLTGEDIISGARFADAVVKAAWPMEIWHSGNGASYRYPPDGDYYEIPLRCLQAKSFANLLVAGRCISVTHAAYGSTRVIGTCIPIGEAAGAAAAEMVYKGEFHVT